MIENMIDWRHRFFFDLKLGIMIYRLKIDPLILNTINMKSFRPVIVENSVDLYLFLRIRIFYLFFP